jgi:hypothetical protein
LEAEDGTTIFEIHSELIEDSESAWDKSCWP